MSFFNGEKPARWSALQALIFLGLIIRHDCFDQR
jgi:hypothetical protein